MKPLLTVITVTWNLPEESQDRFFQTIQNAPSHVEVIVVDNNSKVENFEKLKARAEGSGRVNLIRSETNNGFGFACNQAAEVAKGHFLFFFNPDCAFEPIMWPKIMDTLETTSYEVIQPVVMNRNLQRVDTMGERLFWAGGVVKLGEGKELQEAQNVNYQVDFFDTFKAGPSGAAFFITRSLFESIGRFDESYFLLKEDTDLALRLAHWRRPTLLAKEIVVQHEVSSVINTIGAFKTFLAVRNYYFVLFKNTSAIELLFGLPFIILQTGLLAAYHSLVRRNPGAALKGIFSGLLKGFVRLNGTRRFFTFNVHWLESPLQPWIQKLKSST